MWGQQQQYDQSQGSSMDFSEPNGISSSYSPCGPYSQSTPCRRNGLGEPFSTSGQQQYREEPQQQQTFGSPYGDMYSQPNMSTSMGYPVEQNYAQSMHQPMPYNNYNSMGASSNRYSQRQQAGSYDPYRPAPPYESQFDSTY